MKTTLLPKKPRRVLLVMINHHLGDFVLSLPAMQSLAAYFESPVDAVVDSRFAGLARLLPSIADVIPYEQKNRRQGKTKQAVKFLSILKRLAPPRYDVVIDVGGGIQSVTLTTLTAARHRIGLAKSRRSVMHSRRLAHEAIVHQTDRYVPFMRIIGRERPERLRLRAPSPAGDEIAAELKLSFGRVPPRLAVIHPGAGYAFRKWPGERFAEVADELAVRWDLDTVFIGAPGEENFLSGIIQKMKYQDRARPVIAKLENILALFDRARILISNESGPTHLAAMTEVPVVTIFGPSKEAVWRPVREEKLVVLRGRVCPPECAWGECRHGLACLNDLSVDRVVDAASQFLGA
jgi:ADP-heptose:LPS heptosyltransferase